jgi:hypothetical protein
MIYAIAELKRESEAIQQIFKIQFPDKTGFRLRWNPGSGITAELRPAWVGIKKAN